MTEIGWLILLLFLPFCLHMMVSLVEGIGDIVPRKPKVIIQQEIRYKERVVYKDRPSVKTKSRSKSKPKPKFKPKPAPSRSNPMHKEVVASLSVLGVSKGDSSRLINSLVASGKTYEDAESLLKDCISSL